MSSAALCTKEDHLSLPLPYSQNSGGEGEEVLVPAGKLQHDNSSVIPSFPCPNTVESEANILILTSKWKKWYFCSHSGSTAENHPQQQLSCSRGCQDDIWLCQMENCSSKHEPQGQILALAFGLDSSLNQVSLVYQYSCFALSHLTFL